MTRPPGEPDAEVLLGQAMRARAGDVGTGRGADVAPARFGPPGPAAARDPLTGLQIALLAAIVGLVVGMAVGFAVLLTG